MKAPQPAKAARKILGLFRQSKESELASWHPADQVYPCLAGLPRNVGDQPAIYALWQLGVRPRWLRVGGVRNLASAFAQMATARELLQIGEPSGLFIAWSLPTLADHGGIVSFLAEKMQPAFQRVDVAWDIAVDPTVPPVTFPLPPGSV